MTLIPTLQGAQERGPGHPADRAQVILTGGFCGWWVRGQCELGQKVWRLGATGGSGKRGKETAPVVIGGGQGMLGGGWEEGRKGGREREKGCSVGIRTRICSAYKSLLFMESGPHVSW